MPVCNVRLYVRRAARTRSEQRSKYNGSVSETKCIMLTAVMFRIWRAGLSLLTRGRLALRSK